MSCCISNGLHSLCTEHFCFHRQPTQGNATDILRQSIPAHTLSTLNKLGYLHNNFRTPLNGPLARLVMRSPWMDRSLHEQYHILHLPPLAHILLKRLFQSSQPLCYQFTGLEDVMSAFAEWGPNSMFSLDLITYLYSNGVFHNEDLSMRMQPFATTSHSLEEWPGTVTITY